MIGWSTVDTLNQTRLLVLTSIIMYNGDHLAVFFLAINIFLISSFQNNLLLLASLFDYVTVNRFMKKDLYLDKTSISLVFIYHLMLGVCTGVFMSEDLYVQILHSLCIWILFAHNYATNESGLAFFLDWCTKMNIVPYMSFSVSGMVYRVKANLLTKFFCQEPDVVFHISDLNHKRYTNFLMQNPMSNGKKLMDRGLREIETATFSFENRTIKINENSFGYFNDISHMFYKNMLLSNTSATLNYDSYGTKTITLSHTNIATIDIYCLIKAIVKMFGKCDDVGKIILKFFVEKNLKDPTWNN
jgi:hypothetical protein